MWVLQYFIRCIFLKFHLCRASNNQQYLWNSNFLCLLLIVSLVFEDNNKFLLLLRSSFSFFSLCFCWYFGFCCCCCCGFYAFALGLVKSAPVLFIDFCVFSLSLFHIYIFLDFLAFSQSFWRLWRWLRLTNGLNFVKS